MKLEALIFDLDGTILETLPDIVDAVNKALEECGYSSRFDIESGKTLLGHGALYMAKKAFASTNGKEEDFERFFKTMGKYYQLYKGRNTIPFKGLPEILNKIKDKGIKIFVASNKPDHLLQEIMDKTYGPGFFIKQVGQKPGYPVKPDPILLNEIVNEFGLNKENCLYVGDSSVDIEFAHNACIKSVLCKYGYDNYTDELVAKSEYSIDTVNELLEIVKSAA